MERRLKLLLALLLTLLLTLPACESSDVSSIGSEDSRGKCTSYPIDSTSLCYPWTNVTSLKDQSHAEKVLGGLKDMLASKCAPFVSKFICYSLYPLCKVELEVKPCKRFCIAVRDSCLPLLSRGGYTWPSSLTCEGLSDKLCVVPPKGTWESEERRQQTGEFPPPHDLANRQPTGNTAPKPTKRACSKAEVEQALDHACMPKCHANLLFSKEDKEFASAWMLVWSITCLASTALAVATFAMDSERFLFPERPMVWVSVCYLLYSCGHVLRISLGPDIACLRGGAQGQDMYRVNRHAGHWCAVVFLMLYFSSLAGCLWWVLLTVCWYLCAAKKWAHEVLSDKSVWLHVCAWGVPLLMSVVLLVLHRIEGNELTHLCVVDGSDKTNTMIFLIVPVGLCLLVGFYFLISSLYSTMSMRQNLKWSGNSNFRRLEKLMSKISLFSLLFMLPTMSVLAIDIYEFVWREEWTRSLERTLAEPRCANASGLVLQNEKCVPQHRPTPAFFMLKIFMSLAVGLPSGLIVWFNCKSFNAWQACCCRVILRRKWKPAEQLTMSQAGRSTAGRQKRPPGAGHLLGSSHNKYPPISGIGTSEV